MNGIALLLLVFLVSTPIAIEQETCNGNFDCDQDVDAFDVTTFLQDFGRGQYFNPCPPCVPLNPMLKTGQTNCYDELGNVIDCAGTGQDGEYQSGYIRYADNGDGTVTDNFIKLMRLKDANCMVTNYPSFDNDDNVGDGLVTWQHALDFVAGINDGTYPLCSAGFNDWKLPNQNELNAFNDSLHSRLHPFPFINLIWTYWSSTTNENNPQEAYVYSGGLSSIEKTTGHLGVWPVRGGH